MSGMKSALKIFYTFLPSFLRCYLLRTFHGYEIAKSARICFGAVFICDSARLMAGSKVSSFCFVRANAVTLGARARISGFTRVSVNRIYLGPQCTISPLVEIAGNQLSKNSVFCCGPSCWIFPRCFIEAGEPVFLGKNVGVGGSTYIFTHGHWLSSIHGYPRAKAGVTIGDNVWLPWRCFVMPDVTIGNNVIVGAQSVVNRSIASGAIVAGIPARLVKQQSWVSLDEINSDKGVEEMFQQCALVLGLRVLKTEMHLSLLNGEEEVTRYSSRSTPKGLIEFARSPEVLNVCWGPAEGTDMNKQIYLDFTDFSSSSYETFSDLHIKILLEMRSFGIRYYPIDEEKWDIENRPVRPS